MPGGIWDEGRLRVATEAAGVALWSWNVDTDQIAMDERGFELWGLPFKQQVTFEELSATIHPSDLDRVRAAFASTRDLTGAYETDFRILHGYDVRWISARGRGDEQGIIGRIMFGVFLDVTVRKQAEEARDLLTGEMQHRIKNLFSLMSALSTIALRSNTSMEDMARDLQERVQALAAAHDMIYPGFNEQAKAVSLDSVITALLKAYDKERVETDTLSIAASEVLIGERSIPVLAMVIHELATNSAKYGALSAPDGKLDLSCVDDGEDVALVWTETGRSPSEGNQKVNGFGTVMMERVVKQIGGSINRTWTDDGIVVNIRFGKARIGV